MTKQMGRPSKYNEAIQEKANEYLLDGFKQAGEVIPSLAGLACYLGVNRSTIYEWINSYQDFSDTAKAIEVKQESILLTNGLLGTFNPTITKLVMGTNHGYREKVETDHKSSDGSMSPALDPTKLSDAALAEIMAARNANKR